MDDLELLEKQYDLYKKTCWDIFKAAKRKDPNSKFVNSLGDNLNKFGKLTYKQLKALYNIIDDSILKEYDNKSWKQ